MKKILLVISLLTVIVFNLFPYSCDERHKKVKYELAPRIINENRALIKEKMEFYGYTRQLNTYNDLINNNKSILIEGLILLNGYNFYYTRVKDCRIGRYGLVSRTHSEYAIAPIFEWIYDSQEFTETRFFFVRLDGKIGCVNGSTYYIDAIYDAFKDKYDFVDSYHKYVYMHGEQGWVKINIFTYEVEAILGNNLPPEIEKARTVTSDMQ